MILKDRNKKPYQLGTLRPREQYSGEFSGLSFSLTYHRFQVGKAGNQQAQTKIFNKRLFSLVKGQESFSKTQKF